MKLSHVKIYLKLCYATKLFVFSQIMRLTSHLLNLKGVRESVKGPLQTKLLLKWHLGINIKKKTKCFGYQKPAILLRGYFKMTSWKEDLLREKSCIQST